MLGIASAGTITQTVNIPASGTLPTDVTNAAGAFNFFQSAGAPGGSVLNSVSLEMVITETLNALSIQNRGSTTASTRFTALANFDAGDSANASDSTGLDAALGNSFNQFDPPGTIYTVIFQNVPAGGTVTCTHGSLPCDNPPTTNFPSSLIVDTGQIGGTTASYAGAGSFNLTFSTTSGFTFIGGGNQFTAALTTVASAVATVTYNYTTPSGVPEPATLGMFGGLIALAIAGRKKLLAR